MVVVGSGVGGLAAALHIREAGLSVIDVSKGMLDAGSPRCAQGGMA
ncbi:MAG: binding domain, partial [Mycobacterium sp.]|nr:binding domain [Mycobacterium sp.]